MRILLVEDEEVLADSIARGLRREGMAVDTAYDGAEALEKSDVNNYDVIILDRDLPVMHGDEVCRTLTGRASAARILMLTAASTVDDRVDGLSLGADDYLSKPFAFAELVARVRALSRRAQLPLPPMLRWRDVVMDPARRTAMRDGRLLSLTAKEFAVLEVLLRADGAVVSSESLLEQVWDEHTDPFTNTVRMTLHNLRRKLGDPPLIETMVGIGYRMVP